MSETVSSIQALQRIWHEKQDPLTSMSNYVKYYYKNIQDNYTYGIEQGEEIVDKLLESEAGEVYFHTLGKAEPWNVVYYPYAVLRYMENEDLSYQEAIKKARENAVQNEKYVLEGMGDHVVGLVNMALKPTGTVVNMATGIGDKAEDSVKSGEWLQDIYLLLNPQAMMNKEIKKSYEILFHGEDKEAYNFVGETMMVVAETAAGAVVEANVGTKAVMADDVIEGGTTSKAGYEYLDEQVGSLKDNVKINQYQSAENVNDWRKARGYKNPYKEKTVVQNITLSEDTKFVRVYDGVNSNLEGGWVMRAEDIQGLSPKEIQAKFALEYGPKFVGEVELKAGDTIRLGEVGPNFGFDGGGIQIDLQQQWIGDFTEIGTIE